MFLQLTFNQENILAEELHLEVVVLAPGPRHQLGVVVVGEHEVWKVAVAQGYSDAREAERRRKCAEGSDERVVELGLGRGRRDDFELELIHNGRRRREMMWEMVRTPPHNAHATREQRERQLGVAELKQVLNMALWEVHYHVVQLGKEGEGGSCLKQPRAVEDGGGVRLWMKRRVRRHDGFQQNIVF